MQRKLRSVIPAPLKKVFKSWMPMRKSAPNLPAKTKSHDLPPLLGDVAPLLDASSNRYVIGQRERLKLSIRMASARSVVRGEVLDVGGHASGEVFQAWRVAFPKADIQPTTTDLHDPLPFADNRFDGAIAGEIFEHIGDKNFRTSISNFTGVAGFLLEIVRVLKPGGRCLLTTPNAASFKNISLGMCDTHPFMYTMHYREYTRYEIWKLLEIVGARIVVFETHDVFRQNDELVEAIRELCVRFKLPLKNRGNDIFIVFEKPKNWVRPDLPENVGLNIYPNYRRVKMVKPWSFRTNSRYEGEI